MVRSCSTSSHFLLLGLRFVYVCVCACAPALFDPHPRCLLPHLGECPCSKTRVAISQFEIISRVRARATSMGLDAFRAWDNHGGAWWPLGVGGGHFSNIRQSEKLYVTEANYNTILSNTRGILVILGRTHIKNASASANGSIGDPPKDDRL